MFELLLAWAATVVFLGAGGGALLKQVRFLRRARRAPGLVAGQRRAARKGYKPILQFTTDDGRQIRTTTQMSTSPARYKPGERVTILYDPGDPKEVVVKGCRGAGLLFSLLTLFLLVGLFFLSVSAYATFTALR